MNSTDTKDLQERLKQLEEENELLLLQLHQVQEELEHYFLLNQKNERELGERERGYAAVTPITISPVITAQKANPLLRLTDLLGWTVSIKAQVLQQSGFFDEEWYLKQYPDVAEAGKDPIEHYLRFGATEGRNPSQRFDTQWYLQNYPDVAKAGMNPLLHYIRFGKAEGRQPSWNQKAGADISAYAQFVDNLSRQNSDRAQEVAHLKRELQGSREEYKKLTGDRGREIETLNEVRAQLEQERSVLAERYEAQAQLAAERGREIEALNEARAQLEQEKAALAEELEEQAQLAAERLKQRNELQQKNQNWQAAETELTTRQQLMQEEMVRAEAQLDLIKDMLLREPGL